MKYEIRHVLTAATISLKRAVNGVCFHFVFLHGKQFIAIYPFRSTKESPLAVGIRMVLKSTFNLIPTLS
jgi:hypothetical protein